MEDTKKKRGRRKKDDIEVVAEVEKEIEVETKRRGRKPKGGKILMKLTDTETASPAVEHVILHLKCSVNDLNDVAFAMNNDLIYNPVIPPEVQTYNSDGIKSEFCEYEVNTQKQIHTNFAYVDKPVCQTCNKDPVDDDATVSMKEINQKLRHLKINLYKNTLQDKKAACFWCTYEFDNPPCYIPKHEMGDRIFGYGSFCRPECAVAFLMKEGIDDSTKFERYHLLNQLYGKIYNYKNNIKPAPDPHYLLDKFFGNMSIQEYRRLLKSEHLLLVVDKPMTRVLPELFDDNDNFILGIYGDSANVPQSNNMYKVKRQSEKQPGPSKSSIMRDKFGLT